MKEKNANLKLLLYWFFGTDMLVASTLTVIVLLACTVPDTRVLTVYKVGNYVFLSAVLLSILVALIARAKKIQKPPLVFKLVSWYIYVASLAYFIFELIKLMGGHSVKGGGF